MNETLEKQCSSVPEFHHFGDRKADQSLYLVSICNLSSEITLESLKLSLLLAK